MERTGNYNDRLRVLCIDNEKTKQKELRELLILHQKKELIEERKCINFDKSIFVDVPHESITEEKQTKDVVDILKKYYKNVDAILVDYSLLGDDYGNGQIGVGEKALLTFVKNKRNKENLIARKVTIIIYSGYNLSGEGIENKLREKNKDLKIFYVGRGDEHGREVLISDCPSPKSKEGFLNCTKFNNGHGDDNGKCKEEFCLYFTLQQQYINRKTNLAE